MTRGHTILINLEEAVPTPPPRARVAREEPAQHRPEVDIHQSPPVFCGKTLRKRTPLGHRAGHLG